MLMQGQRRLNFDGFLSALARVAEKKSQSLEDVVRQILAAGGPTVTGTRAEYVKFHDDKVSSLPFSVTNPFDVELKLVHCKLLWRL